MIGIAVSAAGYRHNRRRFRRADHRDIVALPCCILANLRAYGTRRAIRKISLHWVSTSLAARLDRALEQKEAAKRLGVCAESLMGWAKNRHEPDVRHYPRIMEFLGYCPVVPIRTFGDFIQTSRMHLGLSQCAFASLAGLDPSTLANCEKAQIPPKERIRTKLCFTLKDLQAQRVRRDQQAQSKQT